MSDQQKKVWDGIWSGNVSYSWDPLSQSIYETMRELAGDFRDKDILEAGSGSGKISLRLAGEGARVTLVDYSEKALANSRAAFRSAGCEGSFVLSDIRCMEVSGQSNDLTWNAGVLEHFTSDEKVAILREMARVTRPGGMVVTLTPYAKCLPYRAGKAYGERQGTWMYGIEEPVLTVEDEFRRSGIEWIGETNIGFLNSLDFLDYIPEAQPVKQAIRQWYETLPAEEQRLFPGYLLVSAGKVRAFGGTA
ncbi:biotin biosynthesis protein BioC [Paenibacillus konkukensis]|uniref:Biotin biosynthesis protein BioC n=1 Tax=Paenibacillus konkukensis TaxID=2020716 RepID=A0ABY4RZW2_9BACL|nr:methyltransferase domain-containing protein [Paenibacillus konkukensis]UQZ87443.1 biotin biosynthesis protein BioC [Paenibacillus konkukensis]